MVELQADSRGGTGVKIISFHLIYEPLFITGGVAMEL